MTGPTHNSDDTESPELAMTELDPGRHRPVQDNHLATQLDPGRARPDPSEGPDAGRWGLSLPSTLAARYDSVRELPVVAGEADVTLIADRDSGTTYVLKCYHRGRTPDPRVWEFLRQRGSDRVTGDHLVRLIDHGEAAGRAYEVLEYLPGGTVMELRQGDVSGLDTETLVTVVRQVTIALIELHENGIVHRDVKPSNIMLRSRSPIESVIIDIGISIFAAGIFHPTSSATVRYAPPEWVACDPKTGETPVSPATDWWGLGITIVELATGRHPFEGLSDAFIRRHLTNRPVDISAIHDERIRLLCRGLLTRDDEERWDGTTVMRWFQGENPAVARDDSAEQRPEKAEEPYLFLGEPYHHRDLLATALATEWETATAQFFGRDKKPFARLVEWLTRCPESGQAENTDDSHQLRALAKSKEPPDVKLLRLVSYLDNRRAPIYRREIITAELLPLVARRAITDSGPAGPIVADLWNHRLLPLLATASSSAASGTGLVEADAHWRAEMGRWNHVVSTIADPEVQEELRGFEERSWPMLATCLLAATAGEDRRAEIRRDVDECRGRLAVDLPWFTMLAGHARERLSLCVAWLLRHSARSQASRLHERRERERAEWAWKRDNQALREWSRRQNRPVAIGWAAAGVTSIAIFCVLLIAISDRIDTTTNSMIADAWSAAAVVIGFILVVESVLAAEVGGRFHPRYSIPGAGSIAIGRGVKRLRRGNSLVAIVLIPVVVALLVFLTVLLPVAIPIALMGAHLIWAIARYRGWRRDQRIEQQHIEQSIQESAQP